MLFLSLRLATLPVLCLLTLSVIGCGESGPAPLSGTVTFNESPLGYGEVQFFGKSTGDNAGSGYATIRDGKYDTSVDGRGTFYGPHEIRITGYESEPAAGSEDETDETEVPSAPPLFADYSFEAEITSSEFNIDVPANAAGFNAEESEGNAAGGDEI
jgi:hypothetical protein